MLPTSAQQNLSSESHPGRVFEDNHGTEVDIWAVGNLLKHPGTIAGYPKEVYLLGVEIMSSYMTIKLSEVNNKVAQITSGYIA